MQAIFVPLAAPSEPWTILVDILFFFLASLACAWYFFYYKRRDLLGKFWGASFVAGLGALIVFATLQTYIRDAIMWLMSPKIGSTQLSNINLVAILIGGYIALYIMNRINHNKERRD